MPDPRPCSPFSPKPTSTWNGKAPKQPSTARPGGVYDVLIAGQHRGRGEYVEVVPFERVVHTFGWDMPGNPITPGSTTVTYELFDEDGKTRVRSQHTCDSPRPTR